MSEIITPPSFRLDENMPGDRRSPEGWWKKNWMAFFMFLVVVLSQVWNGTNWLHERK